MKFEKLLASAFTMTAMLTPLSLSAQEAAPPTHGIAAIVNDDIITTRDLTQRVLFMIATTGAERTEENLRRMQQQAMRNLVDEHIQMQESNKFEQNISDEEINRSVARLIGRNGLDPNDVVNRLASVGVSIETLRDQVRSEIAWQRIINGLFGSRIRISDAQIDETLVRLTANASKPSYRVAEIYIEATPDVGGIEGALQGANAMIEQINQGAPFPLLAQQFSSAPSAVKGGDIGWVREGELRPELDAVITTMEENTLSEPIQVPGGFYVITLIGKQISEAETVYRLKQVNLQISSEDEQEAARAQLTALKDTLTSCDTLKADARDIDGLNSADMGEIKSGDLSADILEIVENTDVNSLGEPLVTPQGAIAIMVCERRVSDSSIPTRDQIENRLIDQQVAQASKRHLRDLRRQASIVIR